LLLAGGLEATAQPSIKKNNNNYWTTETGPRSNPYTIIRLYDEHDKQFREIIMNGSRLKMNPNMVKRLNRLTIADHSDDVAFIATTLRLKKCQVSSVKENGEQQTFCKY
jgi:predicted phosphohydrolase